MLIPIKAHAYKELILVNGVEIAGIIRINGGNMKGLIVLKFFKTSIVEVGRSNVLLNLYMNSVYKPNSIPANTRGAIGLCVMQINKELNRILLNIFTNLFNPLITL